MVEYRLKRNGTNYTWSFSSGVVPPLFIRGSGAQTGEILKFITSLKFLWMLLAIRSKDCIC